MNESPLDMAIVGGGLAGGLIALAVRRAHPAMRIVLLEAGGEPGGNHRWSWFESDPGREAADLLAAFPVTRWKQGYKVRFPGHSRRLATPYRSLDSRDFAGTLGAALPAGTIRTGAHAVALDAGGVTLQGGERIDAARVIDCRDFTPSPHFSGGWQVFVGHHLRMLAPHGVERPIVMDATVEQPGAYRFVYTLPLAPDELFVEDTYYTASSVLDRKLLDARIAQYCHAQGWEGEIIGREAGVLPVITGGDFAAYRASLGDPGIARAGARGGFAHPLTSYTLPFAAATALAIARHAEQPCEAIAAMIEERARAHWRATGFYRALGRMLFDAARPAERYRVFERFYRLPEPLIERFYAGRSTQTDKARILLGRPPVPIPRAVRALLGKGSPLVHDGAR